MENTHNYIKDGKTLDGALSQFETLNIEIGKVMVCKNFAKAFLTGSAFALVGGIHFRNIIFASGGIGGIYGFGLSLYQFSENLKLLKYKRSKLRPQVIQENLPKQYVKK